MKDSLTTDEKDYIHYLYKITNNLNGNFYIGVHSLLKSCGLDPLTDGYWGSGTLIRLAINCMGLENFSKEILFIGKTRSEVFKKESEIVTVELLMNPKCYNLTTGGRRGGNTPVYTPNRKKIIFLRSGGAETFELVSETSEPHYAFDSNTNEFSILLEEKLFNLEENKKLQDLGPVLAEKTKNYKAKGGKGMVVVVNANDKDRKVIVMPKDDPRYISGEYVGVNKGKKMPEYEVQRRMGAGNSSYGTLWITNGFENKKLHKGEVIPEGWWKGRVMPPNFSLKEKIRSNTEEKNKHRENIYCPSLNRKLTFIISFKSMYLTDGRLITANYLQEQYKQKNSWENVSNSLNINFTTLKNILDFYTMIGYSISSTPSNPRRGSKAKFNTRGSKIALVYKKDTVALIFRHQLPFYTENLGWKPGLPE